MSSATSYISGDLSSQFNDVRHTAKAENTLLLGQESGSISGFQQRTPSTDTTNSKDGEKQKAKHSRMIDTLDLLETMRAQLADLEAQMAQRFEALKGKYGDDVIGGMAATYLNEEELSGLETDEQKLQALADKMLDENGNIKEEYKHLEEAKYIKDWNEAQKLKPAVAKYEGRNHLTAEEQQEVLTAAQDAGLVENTNKIMQSNNSEYQKTVDHEVEQSAANLDTVQTKSTLGFS